MKSARRKKTPGKNSIKSRSTPQRGEFFRFNDVNGKMVEFVEMGTAGDSYVEIGFADKTALIFIMDTRLTMEPVYSDWKPGNERLVRRWPEVRIE